MDRDWDVRDLFRVEGRFLPVTLRQRAPGNADGAGPRGPVPLEIGGWLPRSAGGWRKGWIWVAPRHAGAPAFVETGRLSFSLTALARPRGAPLDAAELASARAFFADLAEREEEILRRVDFDPPPPGSRSFEWICYPGQADGDLPAEVLEAVRDPACRSLIVHVYVRANCMQFCTYCACAGDRRFQPADADADVRAVERVAAEVLEPARRRGAEVELRLDARDLPAHPHLPEILARLNRACASPVYITAPGNVLADGARARALSRLPGLDSMTMTLYGATSATHDRVTGRPGSFAEVVKAARNLMALEGVRVHLNWLLTRDGLPELRQVTDLSASLCDRLEIRFPFSDSVVHRTVLRGHYARLDEVRARLDQHADEVRGRVARLVDFPVCAVPEGLRSLVAREQPPEALHWYGDIPECAGCAHVATCIRVPEPYLHDHGTAGLRPDPAAPSA